MDYSPHGIFTKQENVDTNEASFPDTQSSAMDLIMEPQQYSELKLESGLLPIKQEDTDSKATTQHHSTYDAGSDINIEETSEVMLRDAASNSNLDDIGDIKYEELVTNGSTSYKDMECFSLDISTNESNKSRRSDPIGGMSHDYNICYNTFE